MIIWKCNVKRKSIKKEKKEAIDPEVRKIDLLLQLGVFLIIVSAILFATSTWNNIGVGIKGISLLLFGTLFLGLSYIAEKKLNIKKTAIVYSVLGIALYFFTWICLCYFRLFGDVLSFNPTSINLTLCFSSLLLAVLVYYLYYRFNFEKILYVIHGLLFTAIYFLLANFNLSLSVISCIMTSMLLLVNIFSDDKKIVFKFSYFASYVIWLLVLIGLNNVNLISIGFAILLNIINLQFLSYKSKENDYLLTVSISYFLMIYSFFMLNIDMSFMLLIFALISIYTLAVDSLDYYNLENKKINYFLYTISFVCLFIYSFATPVLIVSIILSGIYLIYNFVRYHAFKIEDPLLKIVLPIAIGAFYFSLFAVLNTYFYKIYMQDYFTLLTVTYLLLHFIVLKSDKLLSDNYFGYGVVAFILAMIFNLFKLNLTMCLFEILVSLFIIVLYKDERGSKYVVGNTLLLFNIFGSLNLLDILNLGVLWSNVLIIFIYTIIMIFNRKEKFVFPLVNFSLLLPLYSLISYYNLGIYGSLFLNIFFIYILYLVTMFFVKNKGEKELVVCIFLTFIFALVFFNTELLFGVYIGLVAFIVIFVGYYFKGYSKLFNYGIILTVINILYRLKDLWSRIPFWIYLLFAGLAIIGFVTYKEINKTNKK